MIKIIKCNTFQEFISLVKNHVMSGHKVISSDVPGDEILYGFVCNTTKQHWVYPYNSFVKELQSMSAGEAKKIS